MNLPNNPPLPRAYWQHLLDKITPRVQTTALRIAAQAKHPEPNPTVAILLRENHQALADLAAYYRTQLDRYPPDPAPDTAQGEDLGGNYQHQYNPAKTP